MNNLIIIPARGGSKSIANKNMKIFCGRPLLYWVIKVARESGLGKICVSSDNEEIRAYALSEGVDAPFLRPANLAEDLTPTEPVLIHALDFYSKAGLNFENTTLLQPTSPFRRVEDLEQAYLKLTSKSSITCVLSVREAIANENPHWMIIQNQEGGVTKFNGDSLLKMNARRQDLPKVYIRNDYVYCFKSKNLYDGVPNLYGNSPELLIAEADRVDVDINTHRDWLIAEAAFEKVFLDHGKVNG